MARLLISPTSKTVAELYNTHSTYHPNDAGVDLFFPDTIVFEKPFDKHIIDLKIRCEMVSNGKNLSYYLYPRSSIAKTDLQLVNSVGIIDAGYRGTIKVALRRLPGISNKPLTIPAGTRLVQICGPHLEPLSLHVVTSLSKSSRMEGGFGSTNTKP